jgi:hypothetical protein
VFYLRLFALSLLADIISDLAAYSAAAAAAAATAVSQRRHAMWNSCSAFLAAAAKEKSTPQKWFLND